MRAAQGRGWQANRDGVLPGYSRHCSLCLWSIKVQCLSLFAVLAHQERRGEGTAGSMSPTTQTSLGSGPGSQDQDRSPGVEWAHMYRPLQVQLHNQLPKLHHQGRQAMATRASAPCIVGMTIAAADAGQSWKTGCACCALQRLELLQAARQAAWQLLRGALASQIEHISAVIPSLGQSQAGATTPQLCLFQ